MLAGRPNGSRPRKKIVQDEYDRGYRFREEIPEAEGPEGPEPTTSNDPTTKNLFDALLAFSTLTFGPGLDELTRYMSSSPENVKNKDLLIWWNDRKHEYPRLARMALDYHTIPSKFVNILSIRSSI